MLVEATRARETEVARRRSPATSSERRVATGRAASDDLAVADLAPGAHVFGQLVVLGGGDPAGRQRLPGWRGSACATPVDVTPRNAPASASAVIPAVASARTTATGTGGQPMQDSPSSTPAFTTISPKLTP